MMGYLNENEVSVAKRVVFNVKASLEKTLTKLARYQDTIEHCEAARAFPRGELLESVLELKKQFDMLDKIQKFC